MGQIFSFGLSDDADDKKTPTVIYPPRSDLFTHFSNSGPALQPGSITQYSSKPETHQQLRSSSSSESSATQFPPKPNTSHQLRSSSCSQLSATQFPPPSLNSCGLSKPSVTGVKWIKHYNSNHKILLVGEGDFSFSASLAAAFGSATNITATSLDCLGFLVRNYRNAFPNIVALQIYGATVLHEVDATEMANLSPFKYMRFDRIVYNFPLAGFFRNQSREVKIRMNQNLVELFLENAKKLTDTNGEIHITHKCNGFFLQWDLKALASRVGLRLKEEVRFDLSDYPGYNTKYGFGGDRNFDCNPSKTYKFVQKNPTRLQDFV